MEEFWVCQHCRSLNRVGNGRCYHCKQSFGSKPKDAQGVISRSAGAVGNVTPFPGAQGRPAAGNPSEPPAYLSTPVVAAPPAGDFTAKYRDAARERNRRFPSPTGWIGRKIAARLDVRPVVGVRILGYLTAAFVTLLLVDGALLVATFTPVARNAIANNSLDFAMNQVAPNNRWVLMLMIEGLFAIGLVALTLLAIFVGLSTHNAQHLGVQNLRLLQGRATTSWFRMARAQAFIAAGLLVPAALIVNGFAIPGLIVALVAVEIAQRRLNDPFGWLTEPGRHLAELYVRLGTDGKGRSVMSSAWRICFNAANAFAIVACAIPIVVLAGQAVADLTGHKEIFDWPGPASGPLQIAVTAILGLFVLTAAAAVGLLVPIAVEMVERQRARREAAGLGRRPAVARAQPVLPAAPQAPQAQPASKREANLWLTSRLNTNNPSAIRGSATVEAPDDEDQASLNSPSTTSSSFPWGAPSEDDESE